jgi:regulator of replication initiation timing
MPEPKIPVQLRALIQQRDGLAQAITNLEFANATLQIELQDTRERIAELEQVLHEEGIDPATRPATPAGTFKEAAE